MRQRSGSSNSSRWAAALRARSTFVVVAVLSIAVAAAGITIGGCGGHANGRSTSARAAVPQGSLITDSSTCQEWRRAAVGAQQQFAALVQTQIAVPSKDSGGTARIAYVFGFIGGRCQRAAQAGRATEMTLARALQLGPGSSTASSRPDGAALAAAMSYLPPSAGAGPYLFQFTDWNAIESTPGFALAPTPSSSELNTFLTRLASVGADVGNGFNNSFGLFPFDALAWEAMAQSGGGPPLSIEGFRSTFDPSSVERHLEHCGFAAENLAGIILYSGSPASVSRCQGVFGDGLPGANTAFAFESGAHVLLMDSSVPALRAAISNQAQLADHQELQVMLNGMSPDPYVSVESGATVCAGASWFGRNLTPAAIQAGMLRDPAGARYIAFGYGLEFQAEALTGQIELGYQTPAMAAADLSTRVHLLRTDKSISTDAPYSNFLKLKSATVSGAAIVMTVGPPSGRHLALSTMWTNGDLAFARC